MGLMNKLRDSMPWILVGMVGIFLITIVFEWGAQGTMFQGDSPDANTIGMVDGQKILVADYQNAINMMVERQKQQGGKQELTDAEMAEVENQAWDQVVNEAIVRKQMEEMEITVTDQEVRDQLFYSPPQYLTQQFTDSTGTFRQAEFFKALRDPRNDTLVRNLEKEVRQQMMFTKWNSLMTGSILVTKAELKDRFSIENDKAMIKFVRVAPTAPPQEFIKQVKDEDVQKYYEAHKGEYKTDETRKARFVIFSMGPNAGDSARSRDGLEALRRRLAEAPLEGIDTFAKVMAEEEDLQLQPQRPIPASEWGRDPKLASAKPGDALFTEGPMGTSLTKITSVTDTGAPGFHSRHILIGFGTPANKDSAKALADKIYTDIKSGAADFASQAMKFSQDGSARGGGDLGWVGKGQFVGEFENVAFKAPLKQVQPPVASQFGYHIIEVLDRTSKSIHGISMSVQIKPSGKTQQMAQQQANIFRARAEEVGFEAAAKAINKEVIKDAPPLERKGQPLFGSRAFVEWAFTADKDDISPPFRLNDAQMIVVAELSEITPKGFKKVDDVKETIKSTLARKIAVNSVKARAEQIRQSVAAGGDLEQLAATDSMLKPKTATIGPGESVPGAGVEHVINNAAFSMKPGEISPALKGENAYYIVQLVNQMAAAEQEFTTKQPELRRNLLQEKQQRFLSTWLEKTKEKAEIKDFRGPQ